MYTVAGSKKWVSVILWLAFVATAAGTRAHAEVPCALVSMQGQEGFEHARSTLPDFSGWWSPIRSTYRAPPHLQAVRFDGVNGELLGHVGVAAASRSVDIVNDRGIVRHLEIGDNPLLGERSEPRADAYVAYWEGQTLVVKTREDASVPGSLRVTERISLVNRDTLEYALHVIAPEKPTEPLVIRVLLHREARAGGVGVKTSF